MNSLDTVLLSLAVVLKRAMRKRRKSNHDKLSNSIHDVTIMVTTDPCKNGPWLKKTLPEFFWEKVLASVIINIGMLL